MKRSAPDADVAPTRIANTTGATKTTTCAIVVRVGGQDFRTSRETLKQDGRGYFAALIEHQDPAMENGKLVYEVDRDPASFPHILSWMRSHRLPSAINFDLHVLEDLEARMDSRDRCPVAHTRRPHIARTRISGGRSRASPESGR